jgi:peptide/nickel transport system substrate-binding protein
VQSRRRVALGTVLLAAVALGCSGNDDARDASNPAAVGGSTTSIESGRSGAVTTSTRPPTRGGELSVGVIAAPASLDPIVAAGDSDGGGDEMLAVYDALVRYDPVSGNYEPRLAESVVANTDRTEWTITLRAGVTFSDGTPFDADAVKFGLDRHRVGQPGAPACETVRACAVTPRPTATSMAFVRNITVTGPRTLVVSLTVPWADFAWLLATEPGMIPSPTAVKAQCSADPGAHAADCSFGRMPVGAGPFLIGSFTPNVRTVVTRNDRYWGGTPFLDGARFTTLPDAGAAKSVDALTNGALDVAYLRDQRSVAAAIDKRLPGWSLVHDGGATTLMNVGLVATCRAEAPAPTCTGKPDGPLLPSAATRFASVRRAIAAALAPNVLAERVTGAVTTASADLFGASRDLSPGVNGHVYDPERARRLVAETKANGWDGKVRYLCDNSSAGQASAIAIETMLKAVDIVPVIDTTKDAAAVQRIVTSTFDFDLVCGSLGLVADATSGKSDGTTLAALTRQVVSASPTNTTGWRNARVDAAVLALRAARSQQERRDATRTIVEEMVADAPFVVTGALQEYVAHTTKVRGVLGTTGSRVLLDEAWLAAAPAG